MQLKKKIAGRFSTEVAYKILKKVQFKTNHDNSFITVLVPNHLALSERQIATISEQLEVVYGINGYYVHEVQKETLSHKTKKSDIDSNEKSTGILDSSQELEATTENTVWYQIRNGLIREALGEHTKLGLQKVEEKECKDTKTLTLTMLTRCMADWVRHNYSYVIRRLIGGIEVLRV